MTAAWPAASREGGGGSDAAFIHVQLAPSAVWWITHDLTKFPSVTVIDVDGNEVEADIAFPSLSEVVVRFSGGMAGRAFLN